MFLVFVFGWFRCGIIVWIGYRGFEVKRTCWLLLGRVFVWGGWVFIGVRVRIEVWVWVVWFSFLEFFREIFLVSFFILRIRERKNFSNWFFGVWFGFGF